MKRSIIYSVIAFLLIITGCRKEDNPKLPDLARVPTPQITKVENTDAVISKDNPTAFNGKFTVGLYFENDIPPQKMDVVIRKNNTTTKVFKENITTFPTTIALTGEELETLFGAPLALADNYDVGVDITTKEGKVFNAFPVTGNAQGSNIFNQPGSSTSITYTVVCPFDINDFLGSANLLDPDFWGATYPVTVTLSGDNTLKIAGYFEDPGLFILVKVNPATLAATVENQKFADKVTGLSFTNWRVNGTGTVDACNKRIPLNLEHSVDQGTFTKAIITLSK